MDRKSFAKHGRGTIVVEARPDKSVKARTKTKSGARRLEARRQRNERRERALQRLYRRVRPLTLLIGVGFFGMTLAIQFWGTESMPWALRQRVERDITARVDFEFEDRVETERLREAARASAPNVYVFNPAPIESIRSQLRALRELAAAAADDVGKLKSQANAKGWVIDDAAAQTLQQFAQEQKRSEYEQLITDVVDRLATCFIVQRPQDPNRKETPDTSVLVSDQHRHQAADTSLTYVTDRKGVERKIQQLVASTSTCPPALQAPLSRMITSVLAGPAAEGPSVPNPLWRYSPDKTAERMETAASGIPTHSIKRKAGSTLIEADTILGPTELALLGHEHAAFIMREKTDPELRRKKLLSDLGVATIVLMLVSGLGAYTLSYQPRIFQKPARALGLACLLLLMIGMSRLVEWAQYPLDLPKEFSVFFLVIAAALLTIAYDQRFAFGAGAALSILMVISSRGDFYLFLTFLTAMGLTVFLLREIRTRGKLVGVAAIASIGAFVMSSATGLIAGQKLVYVFWHALSAAGGALFAGFIIQGILHYFERLFGVATSMTLLEYCDASRPLLRRLAQETPGTYSHSLVLSQMADEACEAIGANGLLARVGALYHDVGKIQKPAYFVENQEANMNRHDRLSPTMSLLIIFGHVKDGIEIARAYGLPRILHQFIAEHHGTTVVKYFHYLASEAAAKNSKIKGRHDREVPESEFRYPGPKPRSRESAILMLCDGSEGAVRSLTEPTLGRVESTVHQVVMDRLNDGQFDECDITLRELRLVEQSIVKSLCAIHHGRIKYPKADRPAESGEEPKQETGAEDEPPKATAEVAHQS